MSVTKLKRETLFGCVIEPYIFQKTDLDKMDDSLVGRLLPFIHKSLKDSLTVYCSEVDKKNFKYGFVAAQPDAVFSHPLYDIAIEFKSKSGSNYRKTTQDNWKKQIRLKDILQTIIASLQVSAVRNKPCLCVLRYMDSAFILYPSNELIKLIIEQAPKVQAYKKEGNDKFIAGGVLAEQLEIDVKKLFNSNEEAKEKGKMIHDKMLSK